MNAFTHVCGLDVSKEQLDLKTIEKASGICIKEDQLLNDSLAIGNWLDEHGHAQTLYVLEATGTYSSKLVYQLHLRHLPTAVVSPMQSKSFMSVLGISNKHDRQAADSLATMGQVLSLPLYQMPRPLMQKRKQTLTALNALQKQRRMLSNQLHALQQQPIIEPMVQKAYEQTLQTVDQQIEQLTDSLSDSQEDEELKKATGFAQSVTGIGRKTAQAILVAAAELTVFQSGGQLAKFFGLTPSTHFSGSSVYKKGRITKFGNHYVRGLLYMCTRSAIRFNPPCRDLYQRLRAKGKPHKVAAVAVMHKLVKQVFACVKNKVLFDKQYHLKFQTQ